MMRSLAIILSIALAAPAGAQDFPPFTADFEKALQVHGECLRSSVDRYPADVSVTDAARGAVAACAATFDAAQAQVTSDYVSRRGYSAKQAVSAAKAAMSTLRSGNMKAAADYAKSKRTDAAH